MSCEVDLGSALRSELDRARQTLEGCDKTLERLVGPGSVATRGGRGAGRGRLSDRSERPILTAMRRSGAGRGDRVLSRGSAPVVGLGGALGARRSRGERDRIPIATADDVARTAEIKAKAAKAREQKLEETKKTEDKQQRTRNKRMFGALLGTLQRFQTDEEKVREREEKRARLEEKLELAQREEKKQLHKEKTELLLKRRKSQQQVRRLEYKMYRVREHQEWEDSQKALKQSFIRTRTKPHIFWQPKTMRSQDEQALAETHSRIDDEIAERRKLFENELSIDKESDAVTALNEETTPAVQSESAGNGRHYDASDESSDEEVAQEANQTTESEEAVPEASAEDHFEPDYD